MTVWIVFEGQAYEDPRIDCIFSSESSARQRAEWIISERGEVHRRDGPDGFCCDLADGGWVLVEDWHVHP